MLVSLVLRPHSPGAEIWRIADDYIAAISAGRLVSGHCVTYKRHRRIAASGVPDGDFRRRRVVMLLDVSWLFRRCHQWMDTAGFTACVGGTM